MVDFAADPAAVKAVLPPHLEPDPADPGGCVAFFVAWQYASEGGEEYLDPARSQYNEFILLVNAVYRRPGGARSAGGRRRAAVRPARRSGNRRRSREHLPLHLRRQGHLHGPRLDPGLAQEVRRGPHHSGLPVDVQGGASGTSRAGGSAGRSRPTAGGSPRRWCELEKVSDDPVYLGKRPVVNLRYFPQLAGGGTGDGRRSASLCGRS